MKKLLEIIEKRFKLIAIFLLALIIVTILDSVLAVGLIFLAFLFTISTIILKKLKIGGKKLVWLLVIAFIIHLSAVLFIYYFQFYPFAGGAGGFKTAHVIATELSNNFRAGNFSFEGVPYYEIGKYPYRHFALIIGIIYTITGVSMLVGQFFVLWLSIMTVLLSYLIVKKIGGSDKWAFIVGLLVAVYPSQLFYSSILLKDGLVTFLSLFCLLYCLKLIDKFSWKSFAIFYIFLGFLIHLRFYTGYALLLAFLISWIFFYRLKILKKIVYAVIIIVVLGVLPEISAGLGFYGEQSFAQFFNSETMSYYQETAYSKRAVINKENISQSIKNNSIEEFYKANDMESVNSSKGYGSTGYDSTWKKKKFDSKKIWESLGNYSKYFIYILLGPLPWQMTQSRHYLALFETLPLIFLMILVIFGITEGIKTLNKKMVPLLLFSLFSLGIITLFVNNYGIITRIRIPAIISLLCLIPTGFSPRSGLRRTDKNTTLMKIYDQNIN